MKSKLATTVIFLGWFVFAAFIFYDFVLYGTRIIEHFIHPSDPSEFLFRIAMLIVPVGSTITGYLINERKKLFVKTLSSEKKLRRVGEEWRATFDSMPYGVMLIDDEFNIIRANQYISNISGIPLKELIFKKCYDVIHRIDTPPDDCPLLKPFEKQGTKTSEYYEANIGKFFMISSTPILDDTGSAIAYVHTLIDITDLKQKETKLIESRDAFFNMLKDTDSAYKELKDLYQGLIIAFVNTLDAKSPWTKGHSENVTNYAISIANEMGLKKQDVEVLKTAAILHDIGKIGTYDVILEKAGPLTEEERRLIKAHPSKGEEILGPINQLRHILHIIRAHHERFDGEGYPDRLKGKEIPLLARILCVADSFDSMTSARPYRPAQDIDFAISELKRCSGTQFDPEVVEAFLRVLEKEKS